MAKYEVLHPVQNGNRTHARGSIVDLDVKDGLTLHSKGHVRPLLTKDEATEVDIETLSKAQLIDYAVNRHGATLSDKLTKAEMIEQIRYSLQNPTTKTATTTAVATDLKA